MSRHGVRDHRAHTSTRTAPTGTTTLPTLTLPERTMTRIVTIPKGPNPRRSAASRSPDGGAARLSPGNSGTCSADFDASLVIMLRLHPKANARATPGYVPQGIVLVLLLVVPT